MSDKGVFRALQGFLHGPYVVRVSGFRKCSEGPAKRTVRNTLPVCGSLLKLRNLPSAAAGMLHFR